MFEALLLAPTLSSPLFWGSFFSEIVVIPRKDTTDNILLNKRIIFAIKDEDCKRRISGVARSLLLGEQGASVASRYGCPGGLLPEKVFETTPLRCSENEGNALFSYILHHKHDYIEHKIGRIFCSIWIKNLCSLYQFAKKAKDFLCNCKRSNISSTKYEMDFLRFTAK